MKQLTLSKHLTNRDDLSLDLYFHEISKIDLLNGADESNLTERIKNGDSKAFELLITSNLRFVVTVAKQYQHKGLLLPDLINEGNMGLIKAALRFDDTRGFKFISYAVWWIRQAILQALAENSRLVRIPVNQIDSLSKVTRAFAKLEQVYHREPDPEEIAEMLDMQSKIVEEALQISNFHASLDSLLPGSNENTLNDVLSKEEVDEDRMLDEYSLRIEIARILATLNEQEAEILRFYFGLDGRKELSLSEISAKLGYSREKIRTLKDRTLCRIKKNNKCKLLLQYLG